MLQPPTYDLFSRLTLLRRDLHSHPELSMHEHRTARKVTAFLQATGLQVKSEVGGTGVVGLLEGRAGPGPVVALRADMDALPIAECSGVPYASTTPGVMHACGHDLHTVIGLGVAEHLYLRRRDLAGTVMFIFQPGEETFQGALAMIADGVLDAPLPAAILGFHNSPQYPVGSVGYRHGTSLAATVSFDLELIGRGVHGAQPHNGVDPIVGAAGVLAVLQTIVSRETSPAESVVFTVGRIQGGTVRNAIAESVRMEGTVRYLRPEQAAPIERAVRRVLDGVCAAQRLGYRLDWMPGPPPVVNHRRALGTVIAGIERDLGAGTAFQMEEPSMGADDFAHFSERLPCAHLRIGSRRPGALVPLHSSVYDANDEAIIPGVRALAAGLLALLAAPPSVTLRQDGAHA